MPPAPIEARIPPPQVKAHALVDATEKRRAWTLVYPAAALRHIVELYLSFELSITARDVLAPVLVNLAAQPIQQGNVGALIHVM